MYKFGFLLKSYVLDIEYVDRLVESYLKYNKENIPMFIVVPMADLEVFGKFKSKLVTVMNEESVTSCLTKDDVGGISAGYINQEIIKIAFWEKQLCENYLCLDSDGVFIRDFHLNDFMYDDVTPYTILVEDNELAVEPEYYQMHWHRREKLIRRIQREIGLEERRMLTCHGFAILSSKVLHSFHSKFLVPRNLNYIDILKISAYEFSWYNMWLQKDKTIPIEFKEHIFKYFHHKNHHLDYKRKGISLEDISRAYVGVVINSNYSRACGVVSYDDSRDVYLVEDTSFKQLMNAIILKFKRRTIRELKRFREMYTTI